MNYLINWSNISTNLHHNFFQVGQGGLKVFHLWRHSQKTRIPQAKNFFSSAD